MNKTIIITIIILLTILSGCAKKKTITLEGGTPTADKIEIRDEVQSCTVYADHVECTLTNQQTYYMTWERVMQITTWDCTAWKEGKC